MNSNKPVTADWTKEVVAILSELSPEAGVCTKPKPLASLAIIVLAVLAVTVVTLITGTAAVPPTVVKVPLPIEVY